MTEKQNQKKWVQVETAKFRIGENEVQPTLFKAICKDVCAFKLIVQIVPGCLRLTDGSIWQCNIPIVIHVQMP